MSRLKLYLSHTPVLAFLFLMAPQLWHT